MAYEPVKYPSWRYHPNKPACVVQDEVEDKALGPEWSDTPSGSAAGAGAEAPAGETDERAQELYETNAKDAVENIYSIDDPAVLDEIATFEKANPKVAGGRKTVLSAVEAKLAELKAKG